MKKLFILLAIFTTVAATAQSVGINADGSTANASAILDLKSTTQGFLPPRMTSAERSAIASPTAGLMVYQTDSNMGTYVYNGSAWDFISNYNFGDIKTGIQSVDHKGWIKLNGRAKSSLTTTQQAQATSLGIGTYLPDATNAFLVQNGGTLGTVSGSNAKTIAQNNLPNVTLSGTTSNNGAHSHTIPVALSTTNVGWGTYAGGSGYTYTGSTPTSSDGAHTHSLTTSSLNGGVGQTSFDVTPQSLSVNTFIYLGF